MVLVHTTGTSNAGPPRYRRWAKYKAGQIVKRSYKLE